MFFVQQVFNDGITNQLIGMFQNDPLNMILVRIYGKDTELIIDRKKETILMQVVKETFSCYMSLY